MPGKKTRGFAPGTVRGYAFDLLNFNRFLAERTASITDVVATDLIRLVGLDRSAAKEAFAGFLDDKRYKANQIEFVNLVIDELTQNGLIEPRGFYESPFTDLSPQGPDALFESGDVDRLLEVVAEVRRRAEVA